MITLKQQNLIWLKAGRYFLAILFIFKAIDCFFNLTAAYHDGTTQINWNIMLLLGCVWSVATLSFITNIWTRVTGFVVAIVAFIIIFTTEINKMTSLATLDNGLFSIAFYFAIIGGSIVVASRDIEDQRHLIPISIIAGLISIGRVLVGLFYFIIGYVHMVNVSKEALYISDFPYAQIVVIIVGIFWFATALSLWSNIITSLSSILAVFMVLIITLTINLSSIDFTQGDIIAVLVGIAGNVGIMGATLVAGSQSRLPLLKKLRM